MARPARRRPACPRLGAACAGRGRARRPEGRGGHGAAGGKILLRLDRRGVRHHHSTAGDGGAPRAAGAEGRGNPRRCRRHRDLGPAAGEAHAARRRLGAGAAPVGGLVSSSTATIGAVASGKGEALFSIIARGDYDLVGLVPVQDMAKLAADQPARIRIVGAGEIDGKVRRVAPTIEPNSQLGQVFIALTTNRRLLVNSSARAMITTGKSCNNVSVPLTAVLYGSAGTVVQVVRRARVETKRVEVGLMSGGQVEIRDGLQEGDIVVARAGALLREGDPVRPLTAEAEK